jgi:hypothetical protein
VKITRPILSVPDLVIVYDLIEKDFLEYLNKFSVSNLYYLHESMTDEDRKSLGYEPEKSDSYKYDYVAELAIEKIREATKQIMRSEYPGFNLERFQDFNMPSLRPKGSSMKPHVDGPPEYNTIDHGIQNLGANFYLNDNYDGGELVYPKLNFEYKPVPNSLVVHKGTDIFEHGVNEVSGGWRLSFGMFGFEHYDAPPLKKGLDSDK